MPLPIYRIARLTNAVSGATSAADTAEFIDLTGVIPARTVVTETFTFPGTPDYGLRRLGRRGAEFTLQSKEYVPTIAAAFDRLASYQLDFKDDSPLGVRVWQNADDESGGFWPFDVLDVQFSAQPKAGVRPATARPVPPGLVTEMRCVWRLRGRAVPSA